MQAKIDEGAKILAVSGKRGNLGLLTRILEEAGYTVVQAAGLDQFDQAIISNGLSLALVNIPGFDQRIWTRCEKLRESDVPLLLLGARSGTALEQAGEKYGAASVLVKPVAVKELVSLIGYLIQT